MMNLRPPDVQGSNPVEKDRQPTDKLPSFILSFIPILWFVIGLYSTLYSREKSYVHAEYRAMDKAKSLIVSPLQKADESITFGILLLISTSVMWTFLQFLKAWTKFCMCCILIFSALVLYFLGWYIILLMETEDAGPTAIYVTFEWFFPFFISLIAAIPSLCIIGMNPTRDIIRNSCRLVLGSPSLIPIFSLLLVLEYCLLIFMLKALIAVLISDRDEHLIRLLLILNAYSGIFMLSITSKFGRMALSEYTINCYWANGEQARIGQSLVRIGRCHIGTIMLSSLWPISYFCATVEAIKHIPAWEKKEDNFFYLISKVLLVWQMHGKTLIFTSIYGTDYLKSSRKVFDSILRRCKLYLATTWMTQCDFFSLKYLVYFLFIAITGMYSKNQNMHGEIEESENVSISSIYLNALGLGTPLFLMWSLTTTVAEALLANQMIILNNQD